MDGVRRLRRRGRHFTSKGARLPEADPDAAVALLNAGASPAGQEFSARNMDINLIALPTEETPAYVKNIKALANDKYQRDIDV